MHLHFNDEDLAFREEVRAFLQDNLPPETAALEARRSHLPRAETRQWFDILHRKGWTAPNWPAAYGGPGWSPVQKYIFEVEYGIANAPELSVIALGLVGPLICEYASDAMKARFLEPMRRGDIYFCQGFSETQAGSDLASLRTSAVQDGADYVINGQKTWTSHAADADYMILLCRTDLAAKPQLGMSMFLLPMDTPGITVRAIESIDGHRSVNEVFLDNVRVPADLMLGDENRAWSYTKFLLDNERTHNAYLGILKRYARRIRERLPDRGAETVPGPYAARYHTLEIDIMALEWSVLRVIATKENAVNPAEASALKVRGSELLLRAGELELDLLGPDGLIDTTAGVDDARFDVSGGIVNQHMYWRASTIFGGANEIQRMIIWNSVFR